MHSSSSGSIMGPIELPSPSVRCFSIFKLTLFKFRSLFMSPYSLQTVNYKERKLKDSYCLASRHRFTMFTLTLQMCLLLSLFTSGAQCGRAPKDDESGATEERSSSTPPLPQALPLTSYTTNLNNKTIVQGKSVWDSLLNGKVCFFSAFVCLCLRLCFKLGFHIDATRLNFRVSPLSFILKLDYEFALLDHITLFWFCLYIKNVYRVVQLNWSFMCAFSKIVFEFQLGNMLY